MVRRSSRKRSLVTLFDTSALITSAKFTVRGGLVIERLLDCCRISILPEVKYEAVDVGMMFGYPDATTLQALVNTDRIVIAASVPGSVELEMALTNLGLEDTDRALIHACRASKRARLVTDDHRLFVTATRLELSPLFLPDLMIASFLATFGFLAVSERMAIGLAEEILQQISSRYTTGFIELSQKRMKGVI